MRSHWSEGACLNSLRETSMMSATETRLRPKSHGSRRTRKAAGVPGRDRRGLVRAALRQNAGTDRPRAAGGGGVARWWTDPERWRAWPASGVCRTAGWRLESVHASARLVRLEGLEAIPEAASGARTPRRLQPDSGQGGARAGTERWRLCAIRTASGRSGAGPRDGRGRTMRRADVGLTGDVCACGDGTRLWRA